MAAESGDPSEACTNPWIETAGAVDDGAALGLVSTGASPDGLGSKRPAPPQPACREKSDHRKPGTSERIHCDLPSALGTRDWVDDADAMPYRTLRAEGGMDRIHREIA